MRGNRDVKKLWNGFRKNKIKPVISVLVIGELIYILYRENREQTEVAKIVDKLISLSDVVSVDISVVKKAAEIKHRYRIPYMDSLIFATALKKGCSKFYTSDRNHMSKLKKENTEVILCHE